ncbi:MAG: ornithine aminotransferase [Chthonomonadales bacterium]|nr:ornithine aminotransferase [Chthonomonadales bacterium]
MTGQVKYYAIKVAAEEAAHRIAGVASVQNNLEVKTPASEYRGNFEIADAVRSAFAWNVLLPDEQISVLVNKGIVTITGTVNCLSQREEAEHAIVNLLGVTAIVNELTVATQAIQEEKVCAAIKSTLERQGALDMEQVHVSMDHGSVCLSGVVPSWNQRCLMMTAAGFAHGVQQVVDDLNVAIPLRTESAFLRPEATANCA